jgi:hypothetical protein
MRSRHLRWRENQSGRPRGRPGAIASARSDHAARIHRGDTVLFARYDCGLVCAADDASLGKSAESEFVSKLLVVMTSGTARLHGEGRDAANRLRKLAGEQLP